MGVVAVNSRRLNPFFIFTLCHKVYLATKEDGRHNDYHFIIIKAGRLVVCRRSVASQEERFHGGFPSVAPISSHTEELAGRLIVDSKTRPLPQRHL